MSLDTLFADFNKRHKDNIAYKGIQQENAPRIPFSSPRANYMLYGGLPRKRAIEFFGDYSCGKTTTALDIIANAQKMFAEEGNNKQIIFVDIEHTLDLEWAEKLGVDVQNLYVLDPLEQSAEQIFQMILEAIETGEVGLIVLDSLAMLVSQQALDKTMEEKTFCGIAGALSMFSNKVVGLLKKYDCTFIGINQVTMDINNPYNLYLTPGGKRWKLACSVRLEFKQGPVVDDDGEEIKAREAKATPSGNKIEMLIKKTKVCKPNRKLGNYTLMYNEGIDKYNDMFDICQKEGIIQGTGWYTFVDTESGEVILDEEEKILKIQGRKNVIEFLKSNPWLYEMLDTFVSKVIEGK